MIERFELLTSDIAQVYKVIQRIKKHRMGPFGLKGSHVMCIYFLDKYSEGLTAADLCDLCKEDKAGISRILADLEATAFIAYKHPSDKRRYRAQAILTDKGQECALAVRELIIHSVNSAGRGISDEERQVFYRVLATILNNLNDVCAELDKRTDSATI